MNQFYLPLTRMHDVRTYVNIKLYNIKVIYILADSHSTSVRTMSNTWKAMREG